MSSWLLHYVTFQSSHNLSTQPKNVTTNKSLAGKSFKYEAQLNNVDGLPSWWKLYVARYIYEQQCLDMVLK